MTDPAEQTKILDSNPKNTGIVCYHGETFDILDRRTWFFDLSTIAKVLSNIRRFAGHVEQSSVAQHCLWVENFLYENGASVPVRLAGLLHDASEAYLLDIPRPIKSLVHIGDRTYYDVEADLQEAIMSQFRVLEAWHREEKNLIKIADMASYELEREFRPRSPFPKVPDWMVAGQFMTKFHQLREMIHLTNLQNLRTTTLECAG